MSNDNAGSRISDSLLPVLLDVTFSRVTVQGKKPYVSINNTYNII